MTNDPPYRPRTVHQPVCAKCEHRCDAKMQDDKEPWRDWFCLATNKELWGEEYNHITGVTTPAKMGHDRCREVNIDGTCTMFEPLPSRPPPAPNPTRPHSAQDARALRPWWRRLCRGKS